MSSLHQGVILACIPIVDGQLSSQICCCLYCVNHGKTNTERCNSQRWVRLFLFVVKKGLQLNTYASDRSPYVTLSHFSAQPSSPYASDELFERPCPSYYLFTLYRPVTFGLINFSERFELFWEPNVRMCCSCCCCCCFGNFCRC